ncbi:MAG: YitT family protein [Tissierellia bacterium]|nr:YitT family protein [Tissierellia bacterium]
MNFDLKRFLKINLGVIISALGLYFFLMPSNLATGGATGLAIVLSHLLPISMGILLGIINLTLFIIAFIVLGRDFGGYTLYASLALSFIIAALEKLVPMNQPVTDDLFINLIFGVFIIGVGMGIVFNQNASTGGTDIIAKIINKYTHIDIGKSLLMSDFLISLFAGLVFGPRLGMYALLGTVINSLIIDKMISGFNVKINMIIISDEFESINKYILEEIIRGTTIYQATGGFSKEDKDIINTIVSRREYIKIRDFVRLADKKAFVSISYVSEVEGEGFTFH